MAKDERGKRGNRARDENFEHDGKCRDRTPAFMQPLFIERLKPLWSRFCIWLVCLMVKAQKRLKGSFLCKIR